MLRIVIFVVCVVSFGALIEATPDFPSYVKVCSKKNLKPCILENMDRIRPHMKKGIPKLGMPSCNPFSIPEITMQNSNLKIKCNNFNIFHLENFEMKKLDLDLDGNKMSVKLNFPFLEIDSLYSMEGKILILQLNGNGKVFSNLTNLLVSVKVAGDRFTKDGKEYIKFKDADIKLSYDGSIYMYFNNLFGDRDELTRNTNEVINESSHEFVKEIEPVIKSSVSTIIDTVMKHLFLKYSVDELFTDE